MDELLELTVLKQMTRQEELSKEQIAAEEFSVRHGVSRER